MDDEFFGRGMGEIDMKKELPRWLGMLTAALGFGLMGCGAARGEMAVVLAKAVRICLECIGIG